LPQPPHNAVRVSIMHAGDHERTVTLDSTKHEV
jgi:hypothetical protein